MKRGGELSRRTPLKAKSVIGRGTSTLKAKAPINRTASKTCGTARTTTKPAAKRLKSRGPKMTPIRKSAKGEACTVRVPHVCCADPATTVWAHSNSHKDGKGMGIKARDEEGCYACHTCHAWLDGGYAALSTRDVRDKFFDLARAESQEILKQKGLMPCS